LGAVLRSKVFIAAAIVAVLVGLYALLGFKVLPGVVRNKAIEYVRAEYGRELSIGEVHIHPFKLQLEVRDVSFPDSDATRMLGFERLFVDFELSSLWRRALYFSDVDIDAPYAHAVIRPDGAMNFADLTPRTPPAEDEEPTRLWIADLAVERGVVDYDDLARRRPFQRQFAPVNFRLQDFKTTPEGGDFKLSARSRADEQFEWKGHFALAPVVSSDGDFIITDLRALGVSEFLGEALPFGLSGGLIDLGGHYRLALGNVTELDLTLPMVELDALSLRARGVDEDWVQIPKIAISDTVLALPASTASIARIAMDGLAAKAWLDKDGSVNLERLFAPESVGEAATAGSASGATPPQAAPDASPPDAAPVADGAVAAKAPPAAQESDWKVTIAAIELANARLDLEDRTLTPAASFALAPVAVRLTDLTLDQGKPVPITMSATLDEKTQIEAAGTIVPDPFAAALDIKLDALDLTKFQPYVGATTAMTIRRGQARATGKLSLTPAGDKDPDFSFTGDIRVSRFHSIDNLLQEDFINFERLDLRKLRFAMAPDSMSIDRATLARPYARISISPEQVLNVAAVFDPEGTATALAERKAQAAAGDIDEVEKKGKAKPAAKPKKGEQAEAAPPPQEALVETGWPVRIREVQIESGQMNFSDQNIKPNFAADIKNLHGTMSGLSTDPNSSAKVDLKGEVGEFSPVTIAGEIQVFAFDRHTDIGMKFENIPLPVFNPYSGRFAGYNIAKGSLTTDLKYLIENRKLDAQHHVRIDQLEWGEATESKEAVPLPLKLATSLLKDVNGVIDLNLPVTGTLDDPKFRIGPIVWQIIKNILVKAVTAPFRLLGSLFKGAEEAQFVSFAPGEATLDPAVAEQMAALAKGLAQKPEIRLDVPIGVVPDLDNPALVDRALAAATDTAARQVLRIKPDDEEPVPPLASLEPKKQIAVLSAVVLKLSGTVPPPQPEFVPPEGTPRKEARAMEQAAIVEALTETARAAVVVDPLELQRLGQARGEAIQAALLASGELPPDRVFLARNDKVTAQDGKVRFELGIK
jgi:hypothetical protein